MASEEKVMNSAKVCSILLNIIGVIAVLTAVFIWLWVFTIGLALSQYISQLDKNASPFLMQVFGGIVGIIVIKIAIGIFKRKPWARIALLVFWLVASFFIFATVLSHIKDAFTDTQAWLSDGFFWLNVGIVALAHVIFLRSRQVKELFSGKSTDTILIIE